MIKKMMLLVAAVGVLAAFAVPAAASAAPLLVNSKGAAVSKVTITQDPSALVKTVTSAGTLGCETIDVTAALSKDTETEAVGSGSGSAGNCKVNGSVPATITSITASSLILKSNTTGTAKFSFLYDVPLGGLSGCTLTGTVGLTYAHKTNTVSIGTPNTLTGSGTGCPTSGTITGSFVLEETVSPFGAITFS
jgi:hypothetical protein